MASSSGKKQQHDDDEESARRNRLSTESKESSYMGFDRGIDSDIEMEMAAVPLRPLTPVNPGCRSTEMTAGDPMSAGRCSSEPHLKRRMILTPKLARWESLDPPEPNEMQNLLPMEATKATPICQNKVSTMTKREENMELVQQGSTATTREYKKHQPANHLGEHDPTVPLDPPVHRLIVAPLASATSLTSIGSSSSKEKKDQSHSYQSHGKENDSLLTMLSGLYAKLLIVMGICFPLAEVISKKIPVSYYEGFYLYLYIGSIAFLLFVYVFLLRPEPSKPRSCHLVDCFRTLLKSMDSVPARDNSNRSSCSSLDPDNRKKKGDEGLHCGSFYLRLGAVAFGIGSMIYSGLEFGQFFELEIGSQCYNILYGLTPMTRMAFTFVQMYFIFLNSRISINKYKAVARFGLMHMIATNLCVWLHVLVQETKHGILTLANHNSSAAVAAPSYLVHEIRRKEEEDSIFPFDNVTNHNRLERSISEVSYVSHECRRSNIMGELVQEASHFLFPCTIEYSLICAAILYIMWKNIGKYSADKLLGNSSAKSSTVSSTRQRHYYQVDCAKANKGLFTGILVLVLSIISIILFFVLIGKAEYKYLAVLEARITELVLYLLTAFAVAVALFQVRELKYNPQKDVELDNILLIVAQSGIYLFTMFSIIGGHFTTDDNTLLVLITSMACLVQVTLQTIFILDASRRHARNTDHVRRKPGREMVTFLLVCNFAMWAINTLQTQRADSNPVQLNFYGFWAWTIITHVTTPLAIYFRFHSTVCLCDIWKRTYKLKAEFV